MVATVTALCRWAAAPTVVVDGLVALALGLFVVLVSPEAAEGQVPPWEPLDAVAYGLMVVTAAGLVVRRTAPLVALAVTAAALGAYLALQYPYGPVLFPLVVAVYSVAVRLPLRTSLLSCAVAAVVAFAPGWVTLAVSDLPAGLATAPVALAWLLAPWAVGTVVRVRRELEVRAREEEARRRADDQRLRVAQEVHDVVGHALAVITMRAGVALHVLSRRPEQAQLALETIKQTSKEALDDLRGTLAVVRSSGQDEAHPLSPAGMNQLDALIEVTSDAGLPVGMTVTGDRYVLPPAVDLAAYRIVQEALTNVLRHAAATQATVHVEYRPGELALEITDDGRGVEGEVVPEGHGITGMRERVAALAGTLEARPNPGGGLRVSACLPVNAPSL